MSSVLLTDERFNRWLEHITQTIIETLAHTSQPSWIETRFILAVTDANQLTITLDQERAPTLPASSAFYKQAGKDFAQFSNAVPLVFFIARGHSGNPYQIILTGITADQRVNHACLSVIPDTLCNLRLDSHTLVPYPKLPQASAAANAAIAFFFGWLCAKHTPSPALH